MSGAYPQLQPSYSHEELVEHFLLTRADLQLVLACRGEANRCGMALLLKALRGCLQILSFKLHDASIGHHGHPCHIPALPLP